MFEARVQQGTLLRKIFDSLKEMVTDVNLDCSEQGVTLQAMDGSHVALVILTLKEPFFENYRCDRPRSLGLNLIAVCKVFKLCNNDDAVILRHEDDGDSLTFVFEGTGEDRVSDFDLKLMQIESEHLGVPDTKFDVEVDLPSKHYQRVCSDLAQFSDSISIQVTTKEIRFSCKGDIGGGSTVLKPKDSEGERITLRVVAGTSLSFAARYLNFFAKSTSLASQIQLKMSAGSPLEVMFCIQDNPELGDLRFYLAPKMDDEGMDAE